MWFQVFSTLRAGEKYDVCEDSVYNHDAWALPEAKLTWARRDETSLDGSSLKG